MMRLAGNKVVVPKYKYLKTNLVFTETHAAPELN
jgi:hypothetical protein